MNHVLKWNKSLLIGLILIVTLSVYSVIGIETTAAVPETEDWIVTSNETLINSAINLTSQNITVKAGGSLKLLNSTLKFSGVQWRQSRLTVEEEGFLFINNSTLKGPKNVNYTSQPWKFSIYGEAMILNSNLSYFSKGIRIFSDNVTIRDSIIIGNNHGIVINEGSPTIINNTITGSIKPYKNAGIGIFIDSRRSNPIIAGNKLDYWWEGIDINSGKCSCNNNIISNNFFGIIVRFNENLLLKDFIIADNEFDGISIWNSHNITLYNLTIGNNNRGLRIDTSNVTIRNSSIKSIPLSVDPQSVDIWLRGNSSLYIFNTTFNDSRLEFRDFDSRIVTENNIHQREPEEQPQIKHFPPIGYGILIALIAICISYIIYNTKRKN